MRHLKLLEEETVPESLSKTLYIGNYMDVETLAKRIRDACLEATLEAYEDAGVQGLCAEGRWEAAVGALKSLDLTPLLRELQKPVSDS